jgi:hypothetical protein
MGLLKFFKSLLESPSEQPTTSDADRKTGPENDQRHDVEDLVLLEYARRSVSSPDEYNDADNLDDDDLDDDDLWF